MASATVSPPIPSATAPTQDPAAPVLPFRVGYGFDLHRLVEGKRLVICGVDVPHVRGCDAHSDGIVIFLYSRLASLFLLLEAKQYESWCSTNKRHGSRITHAADT